jgi:hypothetical protein
LGGGSARRKASTYTGQHNTEERGHTSMLLAGFEPAISMFERPKTVLALDGAAIGTGFIIFSLMKSVKQVTTITFFKHILNQNGNLCEWFRLQVKTFVRFVRLGCLEKQRDTE